MVIYSVFVEFSRRLTQNEIIGFRRQEIGFATKAIHAGQKPELWNCRCGKKSISFDEILQSLLPFHRSVVPPIYMCSTYANQDVDSDCYDNPTRTALEKTLAALDNGNYCLTFPSGTGGQTALVSKR